MISAIFVVFLSIASAGLLLVATAFYASWKTQRQMELRLDELLQNRCKALR